MSAVALYFEELSRELGNGWNRFWFTPASPLPLARIRIVAGVLTLAYLLSWLGTQSSFLTVEGLLPPETVQELLRDQNRHWYHPSPLFQMGSSGTLLAYNLAALVCAALFTAGCFTRISGALTLVGVLGYVHRAPMLTGPTETMLCMLLLYLTVAPSGAFYSVDALLAERRGKSLAHPSWLAGVGLRLLQVHLAALIFLIACSLLASGVWWNGTAIWSLESQTLSRPFDLSWIRKWPKFVNGWTHLFVLVNLAFPVLVWYRLWRPLIIALTALMWLSMLPLTGQVIYILAILTTMLAFCGNPWATSDAT